MLMGFCMSIIRMLIRFDCLCSGRMRNEMFFWFFREYYWERGEFDGRNHSMIRNSLANNITLDFQNPKL